MSVREGDYFILSHESYGRQRIGLVSCTNCHGFTPPVALDGSGVREHLWQVDKYDRYSYTFKSDDGSYANSDFGGTQVVGQHDNTEEQDVRWYIQPVDQYPGYYIIAFRKSGKIWTLSGSQPQAAVELQAFDAQSIAPSQVFAFQLMHD